MPDTAQKIAQYTNLAQVMLELAAGAGELGVRLYNAIANDREPSKEDLAAARQFAEQQRERVAAIAEEIEANAESGA